MTDHDGVQCPDGHPNQPDYAFCVRCGKPLATTPIAEPALPVVDPSLAARTAAGQRQPLPERLRKRQRSIAAIVVVIAVLGAAGAIAALALRRHDDRPARAVANPRSTPSPSSRTTVGTSSASASPSAAVAKGPTLTWSGYKGVHLGEALTTAAAALGGTSQPDCAPPNGTYNVITGIPADVVISDEGGDPPGYVEVIQLTGTNATGPYGIRAGMTIGQARAASGLPLPATISPTTGQHVFTITHGSTVFGFTADPLVRNLTLTTTAEVQQGILGGGGGGC